MEESGSALLTDRYELTMLDAALESGMAYRDASFEVFARRLPPGRRYGVICGPGRVVEALRAFHFSSDEIAFLRENSIVSARAAEYLSEFSFSGTVRSYRDGELYFANSPVMSIEAPFGEALIIETLILSILNFDSAIASAASRMVTVAGGRSLIEMGGRRTHEQAAVAAARAAYICGFSSTSNLEAGMRYGIPTAGTAGHALILAHASEHEAFEAQRSILGTRTTALVDTYDISDGIARAIEVFGTALGAIRIDSGDLAQGATLARVQLDDLGATATRIVVSGDLDEYAIDELAGAPIDGYGVGTRLVGGSGAPTANFVYKLVEIERGGHLEPVSKRSANKETRGGRKEAVRVLDDDGIAIGEYSYSAGASAAPIEDGNLIELLDELLAKGRIPSQPSISDLRVSHVASIAQLPESARQILAGPPAISVEHLGGRDGH